MKDWLYGIIFSSGLLLILCGFVYMLFNFAENNHNAEVDFSVYEGIQNRIKECPELKSTYDLYMEDGKIIYDEDRKIWREYKRLKRNKVKNALQ